MATGKGKRTVSINNNTFEDLRLLAWSRQNQGEIGVSVSSIIEDLAQKFLDENKKEMSFLKQQVAEMQERQKAIFGSNNAN